MTQARFLERIGEVRVQRFTIFRKRSLTSSFACCSLWPVSLPRWTQIEIQEKENVDGKIHPSLVLLVGNRELGYRGRVERIECVRAAVTNAVNTGSIRFLLNLLQSEPLAVCSRDRVGELRRIQVAKAINERRSGG